jgi:DNA-binding PadR family transcriptional regulator
MGPIAQPAVWMTPRTRCFSRMGALRLGDRGLAVRLEWRSKTPPTVAPSCKRHRRGGKVPRMGLPYIVGRYIVARMVRASGSMSSPSYFILAALLDGPLHGYGIIKQAAELSNGRVRLAAGTLYGALDRLAEEGLILADRQEVVEGRTRRYYRLTDHGIQALHTEAARMEQAARVVTRRSGAAATTPGLA